MNSIAALKRCAQAWLVAITILLGLATNGRADLSTGLVAYYPFEGNANDASGNGRHGTLVHTPTFQAGVSGQCIRLQGRGDGGAQGDYVRLPMAPLNASPTFTIALWVREEGMSQGDGESYITFGDQTNGAVSISRYGVWQQPNEKFLSFQAGWLTTWNPLLSGGSKGQVFDLRYLESYNNVWRHYALVRTADGMNHCYVNGAEVGSFYSTSGIYGTVAAIGAHSWGGASNPITSRFIGSVDEARVYSRALAGWEIATLANQAVLSVNVRGVPPGFTPNAAILRSSSGTEVARLDEYPVNYNLSVLPGNSFHFLSAPTDYNQTVEVYYWDMLAARVTKLPRPSAGTPMSVDVQVYPTPATLGITVDYADTSNNATTPIPGPYAGVEVRLFSREGHQSALQGHDVWIQRATGTTGIDGRTAFTAWPTTQPGEQYRVEMYLAGNLIHSASNISLGTGGTERIFTVPNSSRIYGATILVHGFSVSGDDPNLDPVANYWDADGERRFISRLMRAWKKGRVYRYQPATGHWIDGTTALLAEYLANGQLHLGEFTADDNGQLILVFNWLQESNNSRGGMAEAAGDALFAALVASQNLVRRVADPVSPNQSLPMHFIAHSRGCPVTSETVQRLGRYGIKVNYLTYLDPHDFAQSDILLDHSFFDPAVQIWDNVVYAENFYQTKGGVLPAPYAYDPVELPLKLIWPPEWKTLDESVEITIQNPHGRSLSGFLANSYDIKVGGAAFPSWLPAIEYAFPDFPVPSLPHSQIVDYYLGTVEPGTETGVRGKEKWFAHEQKKDGSETGFSRWLAQGGFAFDESKRSQIIFSSANPSSMDRFIHQPDEEDNVSRFVDLDDREVFMGDFSRPYALQGGEQIGAVFNEKTVAGWSHHGGESAETSNIGEIVFQSQWSNPALFKYVFGDRSAQIYLRLRQGHTQRSHNRIYFPIEAESIHFRTRVAASSLEDVLRVHIGTTEIGSLALATANSSWVDQSMPIPIAIRDGYHVNTLRFQLHSGTGNVSAEVHVDDISFGYGTSVAIQALDATAGESNADTAMVRFIRSGAGNQPLTVQYFLLPTNQETVPSLDFISQTGSGELTIPAGNAHADLVLTATDDSLYEGTEHFVLKARLGEGYNLDPSSTQVELSVTDNDSPVLPMVTVAALIPACLEQGGGGGALTVYRTGDPSAPLEVFFSSGGTAQPGSDFTPLPSSVVIPAGESSIGMVVASIDDPVVEGDETVVLTISPHSSYQVGTPSSATVTIQSDDVPVLPKITVHPSLATTNESAGTPPAGIRIQADSTMDTPMTVKFILQGTATAGSDYTNPGASIVIPTGADSIIVPISAINDALLEGDETVVLIPTADPAYRIGSTNTATVTIGDDEQTVQVLTTVLTATEGGPQSGQFTFSRNGAPNNPLTVQFSVGGNATSGTDFTAMGTSVVIPAGQASVTLAVSALADDAFEGTEFLTLSLVADSAYGIGVQPAATVLITDVSPVTNWFRQHFSPAELSNPAVGGHGADPENDGIPNVLEFGLRLSPWQSSVTSLPSILRVPSGGGAYGVLSFRQIKNTTGTEGQGILGVDYQIKGIRYLVETSQDLQTWNSGTSHIQLLDAPTDNGDGTVTVRARTVSTTTQPKFMRLRVEALD